MKALVLSNLNMNPIKSFFQDLQVDVSGFNDFMQQLTNIESRAHVGNYQIVICHIDGDAMFTDASPEMVEAGLAYVSAIEAFCKANPAKILILNTIHWSPLRPGSYSDLLAPQSLLLLEQRINAELITLARRKMNVVLLDLSLIYRQHGFANLVFPCGWYLGRIRYNNLMLREIARHTEQLLAAYLNVSKKVLVLDLDNTLWGGVLGEDGIDGIQLSEDGSGKVYREFQQIIMALKQVGVLVAICSKNNRDEVEYVFEKHAMMILKLADFTAVKINWEHKVDNIRLIAQELNVGLDSVVFIDDSARERQLISEQLPEVTVPDFPQRIENLCGWFLSDVVFKYFPKYRISLEDTDKHHQYLSNSQRKQLGQSLDLTSFIASLRIMLTFHLDDLDVLHRASQMTQKTNQFNVTTKRYSIPEMQCFMQSPEYRVVLLEYEDKFGKEGIVGLAVLDLKKGDIDSLMLSCRIIGRNVEMQLMKKVEEQFREAGHQTITGCYIPTSKNAPALNLFRQAGFQLVETKASGAAYYRKEIAS